MRIEDYGLIGDTQTVALIGRNGSIDWLCLPRVDSPACFAALLGTPDNGRWRIAPADDSTATRRNYRDGSLILETHFETSTGTATLIDFMPVKEGDERIDLVRIVRGDSGTVEFGCELVMRFDYGSVIPWVRRRSHGLSALAGPDALQIQTPVELVNEDMRTTASFTVSEGEEVPFVLAWHPSWHDPVKPMDAKTALKATEKWWRDWNDQCDYRGPHRAVVQRSLLVLKALASNATGGIVAAATTSLPEHIGSVRNWDYRYCWLRDATFTLYALLTSNYTGEAHDFQRWLLRAAAGSPGDLQPMYTVTGERRLTETELPWLEGYEGSKPVRIGNAAHGQFQLDVYGEIIDSLYAAEANGVELSDDGWRLAFHVASVVEQSWMEPDDGIWEIRAPRKHFTHSKVMAWVAMDRAVKAGRRLGLDWPLDRWAGVRDAIHADICAHGFSKAKNAFVQTYGAEDLDASLLLMLLVGFLPPTDPRVVGTVEAIERELISNGLVMRYASESGVDGLPPGDGAFLPCSFWLADCLELIGRHDDALALFERLLDLTNDLGLLAEEYDPVGKRMLGNFPQAFSHVGLINTAHNLFRDGAGAARRRAAH